MTPIRENLLVHARDHLQGSSVGYRFLKRLIFCWVRTWNPLVSYLELVFNRYWYPANVLNFPTSNREAEFLKGGFILIDNVVTYAEIVAQRPEIGCYIQRLRPSRSACLTAAHWRRYTSAKRFLEPLIPDIPGAHDAVIKALALRLGL